MTEKACLFVLPRVHRCLTAVLLLLVLGSGPEMLRTPFAGRDFSAPSHPGVKTVPPKGTVVAVMYAGAQRTWDESTSSGPRDSSLTTSSSARVAARKGPPSASGAPKTKLPFYKRYKKELFGAILVSLMLLGAGIYFLRGEPPEAPPPGPPPPSGPPGPPSGKA